MKGTLLKCSPTKINIEFGTPDGLKSINIISKIFQPYFIKPNDSMIIIKILATTPKIILTTLYYHFENLN